jgi:adenylate kinase family enzyme
MAGVRRISVVGNSGSGKSAFAGGLASRIGVPHIELDSIFHQPNWGELADSEFRDRVAEAAEADGWVVDGNYAVVRDLVWHRADTVVWLDLPRRVVMGRIIQRSLGRVIFRRELWNGNRERWANLLSRDPAKSIVAWAWTQHDTYRETYGTAMSDEEWANLDFVRLRSSTDVTTFLKSAAS